MSKFTEKLNSSELMSNAWDQIDRYRASAGLLIDVIKIEFKDWQPPKELVEVPQCVDEAIRSLSNGVRGAYDAMYLIRCKVEQYECTDWRDVYDWIFEKGNSTVFERAFLDGYTVKKEQLYHVVLPEAINCYLNFRTNNGDAMFGGSEEIGDYKTRFTEQEIKALDERYWQFAVPVDEV